MWVMIAGPYRSGATSEAGRAANLRVLDEAALAVLERGHVPIIGVNNALPLIAVGGAGRFDEIMMPLSLALADRCDACLRIGGPSGGADQEVERFRAAGKPVFRSVGELPVGASMREPNSASLPPEPCGSMPDR